MDINPSAASFENGVRIVPADVTQFDEVMAVVSETKPHRLVNLSYYTGSDLPPRVATKLNVIGMDTCFEAARICGVRQASQAPAVRAIASTCSASSVHHCFNSSLAFLRHEVGSQDLITEGDYAGCRALFRAFGMGIK
jgi:hypothetical protein